MKTNAFQISTDDSLPKYICTECLESLKVAINFRKNCEIADKRFKKILNPMGNDLLNFLYFKSYKNITFLP